MLRVKRYLSRRWGVNWKEFAKHDLQSMAVNKLKENYVEMERRYELLEKRREVLSVRSR